MFDNIRPPQLARAARRDSAQREAAAEAAGKRLPMLDAVRARMTEAVEAGMGDKDWSGMADYTLHYGS